MKQLFKSDRAAFRPSRLDCKAFIFCDPFDNYTTLSTLWDAVSGTNSMSSLFARFAPPSGLTGQGVKFSNGAFAQKIFPSNLVTVIIGAGINVLGVPTGSVSANLFSLLEGTTIQLMLGVTNTGALQFYRGSPSFGGTAIGSASPNGIIANNIWHFFEIVVTIDPSAGAVAVYMDGSPTALINATGLNTRATSLTYCNSLVIGDQGSRLAGFSGIQYDDLRVFDTTGSTHKTKLGDTRLITKMPNGAGDLTQWTPNGATPNYNCVNSIPPNTSKYASSATPGQEDTYAMQSAGLLAAPDFVVLRQFVEKDDAAIRTIQPVMRSAGVDSLATAITLPSTYSYFDTLFENDPNTGSPWTAAGADSAQVGQYEAS